MLDDHRSKGVRATVFVLVVSGFFAGLLNGCGGGSGTPAPFKCTDQQVAAHCNACSSEATCTNCTAGYETFLDQTSKAQACNPVCTSGQKAGMCTACKDASTCLECEEGFLPRVTQSFATCQWQCNDEQTAKGCSSCEDASTCLACKKGFEVFEGKCQWQCDTEQSAQGCTSCEDSKTCLACKKGFEVLEGKCQWQCDTEQTAQGCTICKDWKTCLDCKKGFEVFEGNCQWQCDDKQTAQGCTSCEDSKTCLECKEGFEVFEDRCIEKCSDAQASHQCKHCTSSSTCQACHKGYELKRLDNGNTDCVAACIIAGEDDISQNVDNLEPKVRNGFRYPSMCVDEEDAHFFGLGDWGGFRIGDNGKNDPDSNQCAQKWQYFPPKYICDPDAKYGAAGDLSGDRYTWRPEIDGQAGRLVGQAMHELAKTTKPRFVLNVGDSFYWGGLEDVGCGGDPKKAWDNWRWTKAFGEVYDIPHPTHPERQVPWLSALGNHDYGGLHFDSGWDHQIYQTYKPGVRWRMPGQYWSQEINFRHFTMDVYILDGNYIDAFPVGVFEHHNICNMKRAPANGVCEGPGLDAEHILKFGPTCTKWFRETWTASLKWLEQSMKASKAHYSMIVTHYVGNCQDPSLANIMKQYGVDLCVVGHSHWNVIGQEKVNPQTGIIDPSLCSADRVCEEEPLSIITGGGGGINGEAKATENNGIYGFIDFHVTPTHFNARIINWAGKQSSPQWTMKRKPKYARGEQANTKIVKEEVKVLV